MKNFPTHKATVWQPFPASFPSLPNTCFYLTFNTLLNYRLKKGNCRLIYGKDISDFKNWMK